MADRADLIKTVREAVEGAKSNVCPKCHNGFHDRRHCLSCGGTGSGAAVATIQASWLAALADEVEKDKRTATGIATAEEQRDEAAGEVAKLRIERDGLRDEVERLRDWQKEARPFVSQYRSHGFGGGEREVLAERLIEQSKPAPVEVPILSPEAETDNSAEESKALLAVAIINADLHHG